MFLWGYSRMIIVKILGVILLIILILFLIVFLIRAINDRKNRPEGFSKDDLPKFDDLNQYNQEIEGVDVRHITGDYLNGFHLKPVHKKHKGVVVTFGGSEGSPHYNIAELLAKEGYEVLALFFFGMENQRDKLTYVPLDFFYEVLAYIKTKIENNQKLTLIGISKGAEMVLNLATLYQEIDHLVLYSPLAWTYYGLDYENSREVFPSWTWRGEELTYVNPKHTDKQVFSQVTLDIMLNRPLVNRPSYESAMHNDPNLEAARIKVENTDAKILIFYGEDDLMGPSDISAITIKDKIPEQVEIHSYEGAGHLFFGDRNIYMGNITLAMGGSQEANEKAGEQSNKILFKRLKTWHQ